jgi:hypothetical protein
MRHLLRTLLVTVLAALALPALATAAPTASRGVVVQRDTRGTAVALVGDHHGLRRVRIVSHRRLALGTIVQLHGSHVSIAGSPGAATAQGVPAAGPSAELQGTVLAQSATTLELRVDGFPSGLVIGLGTQTIPALAVGAAVEARVSLGPDPANPDAVVLTLVSLHVEDHEAGQAPAAGVFEVRAEGPVTAITEAGPASGASGSITVAGEHGSVTFAIPAGSGPTGVAIGDRVEARGTAVSQGAEPTLYRLDDKQGHDGSGDGHGGGSGHGSGDDGNGDD